LLAAASLFPALSTRYYLVFALPIAALVARDPDGPPGSGIFDRLGDRRRAVGVCVTAASVVSIAQIALPAIREVEDTMVLWTTSALAPGLWLLACTVIVVSYARRPAPLENEFALERRGHQAVVDAAR
jgi:hypothetical protein